MNRSKRFAPIQEIVSSSADELSRPLAEAARHVAELERQLLQLQSYRDDYASTSISGGAAMDAVKLQNQRSFLERLGEALRQHLNKLDAARSEYEMRHAQWSVKRIEAESLDRAILGFRRQEQQAADRREQREGDDAAMRLAFARAAADNA